MIEKLLLVALGGALGASARFLVILGSVRFFGPDFPWGTLIANVIGSIVMGVMVVVLIERLPGGGARLAPLVMTGMLGGFTTFSTFSLDAVQLMYRARWIAAAGYVSASVVLSIIGLALGMALARAVAS